MTVNTEVEVRVVLVAAVRVEEEVVELELGIMVVVDVLSLPPVMVDEEETTPETPLAVDGPVEEEAAVAGLELLDVASEAEVELVVLLLLLLLMLVIGKEDEELLTDDDKVVVVIDVLPVEVAAPTTPM